MLNCNTLTFSCSKCSYNRGLQEGPILGSNTCAHQHPSVTHPTTEPTTTALPHPAESAPALTRPTEAAELKSGSQLCQRDTTHQPAAARIKGTEPPAIPSKTSDLMLDSLQDPPPSQRVSTPPNIRVPTTASTAPRPRSEDPSPMQITCTMPLQSTKIPAQQLLSLPSGLPRGEGGREQGGEFHEDLPQHGLVQGVEASLQSALPEASTLACPLADEARATGAVLQEVNCAETATKESALSIIQQQEQQQQQQQHLMAIASAGSVAATQLQTEAGDAIRCITQIRSSYSADDPINALIPSVLVRTFLFSETILHLLPPSPPPF